MRSWYNICTLLACSNINNCTTILENNIQCDLPTLMPTPFPTPIPSANPTTLPSISPSVYPTYEPSLLPTWSPSTPPTLSPINAPVIYSKRSRNKVGEIIIISSVSLMGVIGICIGGKVARDKYKHAVRVNH